MNLPLSPFAKKTLSLIDLTELAVTCDEAQVHALAAKALALRVSVAALCVRPAFVRLAKELVAGTPIKVATVINFPDASHTAEDVGLTRDVAAQVAATRQALADGADEIDLVFAWGLYQAGEAPAALAAVAAVKEACGPKKLKVILESGAFADLAQLRRACDDAIEVGADMLKTSTGFYKVGATPEAVEQLCAASLHMSKAVGIKVSGGVRTAEDARLYLDLITARMGAWWMSPDNVRLGASKLLDALVGEEFSSKF